MSFSVRAHRELPPHKKALAELTSNGAGIPLTENWNERWCSLPEPFTTQYDEIYNFEIYDDDVFVVTFPKCGTTWMQEAAWLLLNDLDYQTAKEVELFSRSVFLEFKAHNKVTTEAFNTVKKAAELQRPRLIKSHLPAHLLPHQIWEKKTKIIYCARNLKDVAISFCHFHIALTTWQGTIDEFAEDLIKQDVMYTPYWPHVLDFWKLREEPQIFFTTFEHMKRDLGDVLTKLNQFLGKPALEADKLKELEEHLSFKRMKENESTNPTQKIGAMLNRPMGDFDFMRRGIVGAYRDELSEESQRKLDALTEECLEGQGVTEKDIFGPNSF